ncbi:hypothetical protein MYP_3297 [Sporocytophaga myxococcoides]|uniref:DUF4145 domain-containing protein n=1 Tax=Sporocytophaga myxococcoides TaxID=153721 RepID=A0A098LIR7_9BACT|nr:hypothetical protein [Sporocytophaga myxococcoides]GAL86068.1 hypothetical protein MYP_3297 [Sporocytophaga myxococcoides]
MKKNPIENGNEIFEDILKEYPEQIFDIETAAQLLINVIKETEGLVIVDFLDYGGWDRLNKCHIDKDNGLIYLIEEEDTDAGYRDGLVLKFKDLLSYHSNILSGIFLRGYALKRKNIKKILNNGKCNFSFKEVKNFALTIEKTTDAVLESYDVLNSPIYSVAIIPKNTSLCADRSQELLFKINFNECMQRLQKRRLQLLEIDKSDEDSICEKANTARRIFEFILKIECCLIEHKVSFWGFENTGSASFKEDYSELLLGPLQAMVKRYKPKNRQDELTKIINIGNKLSHDSGEAIDKKEAIDLYDLMIEYTKELLELIKDHSLATDHYTCNLKKIQYDGPPLQILKLSDILKKD